MSGDKINRSEFLKEMKKSFSETMKGISAPFVEDKAEQIDDAASILLGKKKFELPDYLELRAQSKVDGQEELLEHSPNLRSKPIVKDVFLNENSFYLVIKDHLPRAIKKQCPTCKNILMITAFDQKCKCFFCDKSLSIESFEGDLSITELELIQRDGKWFVLI